MSYAVPVYQIPTLDVAGRAERYPVRRIYTIGRNYAAHAAETGLGGGHSVPGISLKPADSILSSGGPLPYPPATAQLEPEVEMVVAIGRGGANISREAALDHVFGYAVGFDVIRRDVLADCIKNQHSWDLCKSFAGASPVSPIRPAAEIGHPAAGAIWIKVNGAERQRGDLSDLIWTVPEILARISSYERLEPGDIVFTGTPKGPKPVARGDALHGHIAGVGDLHLTIA